MVPVTGQSARSQNASCNRRAEQFFIPGVMICPSGLTSRFTGEYLADGRTNRLEGLPVASRRKRVDILFVLRIPQGIKCPLSHLLDQLFGNGVPLDRKRVVCIVDIDFIDSSEIGFAVNG